MKIKSKKMIHYKGTVTDLCVENSHTYNVEGLGVHNSSGGSLMAYFLGITEVDSILHDLKFERFYNEGRNTADNVEYPDIDIDFPKNKRNQVIKYIEDKYGIDRVAQIVTFGRMLGAGALKDVLRVYDVCGFHEANEITKHFPQEASIEEFLEEQDVYSIVQWILENEPEKVAGLCQLEDDGTLSGEMAPYFEKTIRLEGTFKSKGKHAAGLVISKDPLVDICPMIQETSSEKLIVGYDMNNAKKIGLIKFDILSLATLDRLQMVNDLIAQRNK